LYIRIDYNSGEPILRQVIAQIKLLIVSGSLRPGDKIPSIRELSKELHINPTTVSRIYNQLAQEGVLVLRQGQGAFIADQKKRLVTQETWERAAAHAKTLLVEGLRSGLLYEQILEILEAEYAKIKP
jgi:GntR family transcriptional regulator